MPHTRADLAAALCDLGLKAGGVVMIHASVRAVGSVFGGPDEIIRAVEDAVTPGGLHSTSGGTRVDAASAHSARARTPSAGQHPPLHARAALTLHA